MELNWGLVSRSAVTHLDHRGPGRVLRHLPLRGVGAVDRSLSMGHAHRQEAQPTQTGSSPIEFRSSFTGFRFRATSAKLSFFIRFLRALLWRVSLSFYLDPKLRELLRRILFDQVSPNWSSKALSLHRVLSIVADLNDRKLFLSLVGIGKLDSSEVGAILELTNGPVGALFFLQGALSKELGRAEANDLELSSRFAGCVVSDVLFYPFETVLHRRVAAGVFLFLFYLPSIRFYGFRETRPEKKDTLFFYFDEDRLRQIRLFLVPSAMHHSVDHYLSLLLLLKSL